MTKTETKINILLVDDHSIVRAGFRRLIESEPNIRVIAEAEDGPSALNQYKRYNPDIALIDLNMPGMSGLELISALKAYDPSAKILVMTIHESEPFPSKALEGGATGYLTKHCETHELITAIKTVSAGNQYINGATKKRMNGNLYDEEKQRLLQLTGREFEIFCMLAEGKSYIEIAKEIHLSPKTIQVHRANLLKKLKIKKTSDIIYMAIQHEIIKSHA